MVVLDHAGPLLVDGIPDYRSDFFAPFLVPEGFQWVWLFLVISGFLLTKAFTTGRFVLSWEGIRSFYSNRLWRLVPLLWILTATWALLSFTSIWPATLPPFNAFRDLQLVFCPPWMMYFSSVHPVHSSNSTVWSVLLEIQLCFILPLFLRAIGLRWQWMIFFLSCWLAGIGFLAKSVFELGTPLIFPVIYASHLYNFGFFGMGILLALFPAGLRFARQMPWWGTICLGIFGIGLAQWQTYYDTNWALAVSPIYLAPILFIVIGKADSDYQIRIPKSAKEMIQQKSLLNYFEVLGVMSYSIYLVHKPLAYILIKNLHLDRWVHGYFQYYMVLTGILIVVVTTSIFLFYQVENRFRVHQKKI
jgi:peptidoglycan/LPS O-acetylase OafA/YrhL